MIWIANFRLLERLLVPSKEIQKDFGTEIFALDDAMVTFDPRPHLLRSDNVGYRVNAPGTYPISAEAHGFQAETPIIFGLYRANDGLGGAQPVACFDFRPGDEREISFHCELRPGDYIYPAPMQLE